MENGNVSTCKNGEGNELNNKSDIKIESKVEIVSGNESITVSESVVKMSQKIK